MNFKFSCISMHKNRQGKRYHFENSKVRKVRKLITGQPSSSLLSSVCGRDQNAFAPQSGSHGAFKRVVQSPCPARPGPAPRAVLRPAWCTVPPGSAAPPRVSPSSANLCQLKRARPPTRGRESTGWPITYILAPGEGCPDQVSPESELGNKTRIGHLETERIQQEMPQS